MTYPLNQEAFEKFCDFRIVAHKERWRCSTGKLFPIFNKDAKTKIENKLMKHPHHVQDAMVRRAMRKKWISVFPNKTLDYDTPDAPKRTRENIDPKVSAIIDKGIKPIPAPKTRDPAIARRALSELSDMLELKKGSDQDPEFKKNWLDVTLKHAKRE